MPSAATAIRESFSTQLVRMRMLLARDACSALSRFCRRAEGEEYKCVREVWIQVWMWMDGRTDVDDGGCRPTHSTVHGYLPNYRVAWLRRRRPLDWTGERRRSQDKGELACM